MIPVLLGDRTRWDRVTRAEARDFCRWMLIAGKPGRPHWRASGQEQVRASSGKAYAPSVRARCETVLRSFYDYHLEAGTGPVINPFPPDRSRRGGRANAHHNPMEPFRKERAGQPAEFVAVQTGGVRLVIQPWTADVSGRGVIQEVFFDRVSAEPRDSAQQRRPGRQPGEKTGTVTPIRTATNTALKAIKVGSGPITIAITP